MTANKYQQWTRTTAIYPKNKAIDYLVMGLVSEAGEVAGKRKKELRDGVGNVEALVDEVADVLWYAARLTDEMGFSLESVFEMNKQKLMSRMARNVLKGSGDVR